METAVRLNESSPSRARPVDERDFVARFQAGQQSAFDEIVAAHRERVAGLSHRLLGEADEVEDVVQEVFLAVFQGLRRFRGECKFTTWLNRIVLNKCRSQVRKRLLRRRLLRWVGGPGPTPRRDPARQSAREETHQQLHRAVHELPATYREPIVLSYFQGLSTPEIGEVLGISAGAVEVRLSRARARLKQMLLRLGEEP